MPFRLTCGSSSNLTSPIFSGSKTVLATANVTVDLLNTLYDGREVLVAGQTMLEKGDFHGLEGPLGVQSWWDRAASLAW